MQRKLDLAFKKLVIGADLSALAYAVVNSCPILFLRTLKPYEYDEKGQYSKDIDLWNKFSFLLSTKNNVPFSDLAVSIRLEDDKLKVATKQSVLVTVSYDSLVISDDYLVGGLPTPVSKTSNEHWVLDWLNINRGAVHDIDVINGNDNFVNKLYFYPSKRYRRGQIKKDCVTTSKLTDEQLTVDGYNENMVRLKARKMMLDAGINGIWDKTNNRFKKPVLTSTRRDIHTLGKNVYPELANIEFLYTDTQLIKEAEEIYGKTM